MNGKRHPLLIYERIGRQRRWKLFFAGVILAVLYVLPGLVDAETAAKLWGAEYDYLLLTGSILAFLLFVFKLVAPKLAYVQCSERQVRIQTPFLPVFISYRRIVTTRPNQWGRLYPPEKRRRSQRHLLEQIAGGEVVVLDLKGWPAPVSWLRLWIPDVMFSADETNGLILWVKDWMTLNRELADFKDRRRETYLDAKPQAGGNRPKR